MECVNPCGSGKGKVPRSIPVVRLQIVRDKMIPYAGKAITGPPIAVDVLRDFLGEADREYLLMLCLDAQKMITALNIVSIGNLTSALVHPREVFKLAILANAKSIILAHNHPSGSTVLSRNDIEMSTRLVEAGELLGIEVLDHLILGVPPSFISLKAEGLIS